MPEIIFWADALYLALRTPILNMPEYPTPWLPYLQDGRNYFVSKNICTDCSIKGYCIFAKDVTSLLAT